MNRPEFSGHYKKLHKGTVVLGLTPRPVDPAAEITVRAGRRAERCESTAVLLV